MIVIVRRQWMFLAAALAVASNASAQSPEQASCDACPHCRYEEREIVCDVICRKCVCKEDVKQEKHSVFATKCVPFCRKKLPSLFGCDCCVACQKCPREKRVLLKKTVECEKEIVKCVPEETIVQKRCRVRVAIPCGQCEYCQRNEKAAPIAEAIDGQQLAQPARAAQAVIHAIGLRR